MIAKLLKRKSVPTTPASPEVPPGVRVWAVGDVHGRLDVLEPLVEAIRADLLQSGVDRRVCIFLGDYIDRGPASREVVSFLTRLSADSDIEWRFLRGNHEQTMLDFLDDPSVGADWCTYGGTETLASYGLRPPAMRHQAASWAALSADLAHKVAAAERAFLENLELSISIGDYFFSHAGARPGVPLSRQSDRDLLWIRRSFLDHEASFEQMIVHGHTPSERIYADHRRLGIDTKAYETGVLTALGLMGSERFLIEARQRDDGVQIGRLGLSPSL